VAGLEDESATYTRQRPVASEPFTASPGATMERAVVPGVGSVRASFEVERGENEESETFGTKAGSSVGIGPIFPPRETSPVSRGEDRTGLRSTGSFSQRRLQTRRQGSTANLSANLSSSLAASESVGDPDQRDELEELSDEEDEGIIRQGHTPAANQAAVAARARIRALMSKARSRAW